MRYVCILDQSGEVLVHRNMKTDPEAKMLIRIACKGVSRRVMHSAFCPRMALLPNTSAPDGICCRRWRIGKR
jgi:hypothetical protein